jgi:hypothetical protein
MNSVGEEPRPSPGKRSRTALPANPSQSKSNSAAVAPSVAPLSELAGPQWTFLTNHAHVLLVLSRNPSVVLREVALQVRITERAVQRIIADLEASRFIEREKIGRQNRYRIRVDQPLRHPIEAHRTIGELLALINGEER